MKKVKNKKEKIEVAAPEEMVCVESFDKKEMVCGKAGEVVKVGAKEPLLEMEKKKANLWIGTVNFFAAPYQGLKGNYEKKYGQAKKLFIIDLILLGIIGLLFGFNIYLLFSRLGGNFSWFNFPEITVGGGVSGPVAESLLKTEIKINGQASAILNPGEDLEYVIFYSNSGNKEIYDVGLKVNLEGAAIDLNQFSSGQGVLRGGAVVWTKDQVPDFVKLSPGAKGELKFKVSTSEIVPSARALNFGSILEGSLEIFYKLESDFGEAHNFKTAVREDKFNSDLFLDSLARYYTQEGDQLGFGPLPPKVGEETSYWVFWSINNNLNDLSDVSVSAVLPPGVSWTGKMSVTLGELTFNAPRRQVNWNVGKVGRYTGEDWPKLGVAFEVALTPTAEEAGKEAVLLSQVKFFGEDKFTGQFLEKSGPIQTTDLIYDNLARDKGRVVK